MILSCFSFLHRYTDYTHLETMGWNFVWSSILVFKVYILWECHKIWKNLPLEIWRYSLTSNFKWKIFLNFVAFSEYPNFTYLTLEFMLELAFSVFVLIACSYSFGTLCFLWSVSGTPEVYGRASGGGGHMTLQIKVDQRMQIMPPHYNPPPPVFLDLSTSLCMWRLVSAHV